MAVSFARQVEAVQPLQSGMTLSDRWRIGLRIGGGAATTIYSATNSLNGRVALEVLDVSISQRADLRQRFVEAGLIANTIGHRAIARVIEDGATPEGVPFVVLDLREGESLEPYRLRAGGKLAVEEVVDLFMQLLEGLEAAHAKGIFHGAIAAASLFVEGDGRLRILDYGFAASLVQTKPSERSDLHGAAETAYLLFTGQEFVRGTSRPLEAVAPQVPAEVAAIVDAALMDPGNDPRIHASMMRKALGLVTPQKSLRRSQRPLAPDDQTLEVNVVDTLMANTLILEEDPTVEARNPEATRPQPALDAERLNRLSLPDEPAPTSPTPPPSSVKRAVAPAPAARISYGPTISSADLVNTGAFDAQGRRKSRAGVFVVLLILVAIAGVVGLTLASR